MTISFFCDNFFLIKEISEGLKINQAVSSLDQTINFENKYFTAKVPVRFYEIAEFSKISSIASVIVCDSATEIDYFRECDSQVKILIGTDGADFLDFAIENGFEWISWDMNNSASESLRNTFKINPFTRINHSLMTNC